MLAVQYLIVFAMVYLFLFKFLNFETKKKSLKQVIIFLIILIIIDLIRQFYYGYQPVMGYDSILGVAPVIFTSLYVIDGFRKWQAWVVVVIAIFISLFISFIATVFIFGLMELDLDLIYNDGIYATLSTFAGLILFSLIYFITKILNLQISITSLSKRDILLILFFIYIFGFLVTSIFMIGATTERNTFSVIMNFFTLLSGLVGVFIVAYLASQRTVIDEIKNRENQQELIFHELAQNYERLLRKDEELKSFKHNINDEIKFLDVTINDSSITDQDSRIIVSKYISEMKGVLSEIENITGFNTGSDAVNAKWFDLTHDERYKKIETTWIGRIPTSINITHRDMVLLFSNLLNNAFEASSTATNTNQYVTVEVLQKFNSLTFVIKNSHRNEINKGLDGNLLTTKPDKNIHGIGTKIIKKIVKKYNGEIEFRYSDDEFLVLVIFDNILK